MSFEQRQNGDQKQKTSLSWELINNIKKLEEPEALIQDELELEIFTDKELEGTSIEDHHLERSDADENGKVDDEIDWDNYLPKDDAKRIPTRISIAGQLSDRIESLGSTTSLHFHLMEQLVLSAMNVVQKEIGFHIIEYINDDGYLSIPIEELRREEGKYEIETWNETLRLIKQFDPLGVAARDLKECLLIQARSRKKNHNNKLIETIIQKHWNDMLNKKFDIIAKDLSLSVCEVCRAVRTISKFDFRPGQRFNRNVYYEGKLSDFNDSAFHVRPDFKVKKVNGKYKVSPKRSYIPPQIIFYYHDKLKFGDNSNPNRLENEEFVYSNGIRKKISEHLIKRDKSAPLSAGEMQDLIRKRELAENQIKMESNRHRNIWKVVRAVVQFQKDFFDSGKITALKPLIALDIANQVNLDESTVRRIRKNKFIDTPHGVYDLEYFFDKEGFKAGDGKRKSSKAVKELIKEVVNSEDKTKPYSDQQITDILSQSNGIEITIKTVSNYRESLGILSSRYRKWPC